MHMTAQATRIFREEWGGGGVGGVGVGCKGLGVGGVNKGEVLVY